MDNDLNLTSIDAVRSRNSKFITNKNGGVMQTYQEQLKLGTKEEAREKLMKLL